MPDMPFAAASGRAVWIADDDDAIRFVLSEALREAGADVRAFAEAEALFEALEHSRPDAIVSDVRMPGMSGLDLLKRLRERSDATPVIVMSAFTDVASTAAAYRNGAFDYLPKPFDLDQAVSAVQRALAQAPSAPVAPPVHSGESELIGAAPAMREVFRSIGRIAGERSQRADHGPDRHRQGARRARGASTQQSFGSSVRRAEHGRDSGGAARVRTVRPRGRRVHRRTQAQPGSFRAGARRHAVPRRDRRHAAVAADAAAARARRERVLSRRRARTDPRRRARRRGHAPGPRRESRHRRVPCRSTASSRRRAPAPAVARRTQRGRAVARQPFRRARGAGDAARSQAATPHRRWLRSPSARGPATCASSRIYAGASS